MGQLYDSHGPVRIGSDVAVAIGRIDAPEKPAWALHLDERPTRVAQGSPE